MRKPDATAGGRENDMDGLNQEERALAWAATWHPSFHGTAIVDKDFNFKAVNPQFCDILGITPAELIDRKFTDMTAIAQRDLDARNAKLVMDGTITCYAMPKTYEFMDGRHVNVLLLVSGVYSASLAGGKAEFLFFVSRVMEQPKGITISQIKPRRSWLSTASSAFQTLAQNQAVKVLGLVGLWLVGMMAALLFEKQE